MKKTAFVLLLTLSLGGKSFACLNGETLILANHSTLYADGIAETPRGHRFFDENSVESFKYDLKQLDSLYKATGEIKYLSDQGLILIVLGEYKKAIELYREIEMTEPDRYSTASNLGTAFELDGQNKQALFWIEKAVKLNKHSHHNSEWIHVNILKAKLEGAHLINTRFLLGTNFGTDSIPRTNLRMGKLDALSEALYYQLNERTSFVKPPNKIVAQLMFDLGNITFLRGQYRVAFADYLLAKEYGYDDRFIDKRMNACQDYRAHNKLMYVPNRLAPQKEDSIIAFYIALPGLFLIALGLFIWRRSQKLKGKATFK